MDEIKTEIWQKYEKSHDYMNKMGLVGKANRNWNFYIGNQWVGMNSGGESLPSLNFIKPIVRYKVSTICQNVMTANFSDMSSDPALQPVYKTLNQKFAQSWEKSKMNTVMWNIIKQAAVQGDSYCYWGGADTNEPPQILPNTQVFFGDENTSRIQDQPYIIIAERHSVEDVKKAAIANGISDDDLSLIASDNETDDQIVNREEVSDKVTTLLYMAKDDNGIVNVARATKSCVFQPLEAKTVTIDGNPVGGLTSYPLVPYLWESKPNSARGVSEVDVLLPNQIELNKTLARRAIAVKLGAYPRLAYDTTAIANPEDLDKVGVAIGVNGGGAQSINQMISYLNATNISSDAESLSTDLLDKTKDLAGVSDYATGNINPEQASGSSIIAARDQSAIPLNEQVRNQQQFVEDIALLFFDIWTTYQPDSFKVETTLPDGNTIMTDYPYDKIKELKPNVRIDVSQDNQWTKLAEQQTLDNLMQNQQITFEEWVNLCPDNGAVPKGKLMIVLDRRRALAEQQQALTQQQGVQQPQQTPQAPQQTPQQTPQQQTEKTTQ